MIRGKAILLLAATLSMGLTLAHATAAERPGAAIAEIELGPETSPIRKAEVLVDPSQTLTIEQVREMERTGKAAWRPTSRLNFGYSSARYWLKVPVANNGLENSDWVLEFGYPLIQHIQFHQFVGSKALISRITGRLMPFKSRKIGYRTFLFDFAVPKGTRSDLYVMIESVGTVFAPMAISTREEFFSQSAKKTAAVGIYCGIMLAMVLYNLFLFLTIRDRNYLFYIGYALTFGLLMNTLNGMTYQYLWPEWVQWNKVSVPVLVGICYTFLAYFTRSFLDTKRLVPRLNWGLDVILAGAGFLIVGGIFHYGLFVNRFTSLFISIAPVIVLPIALRCMYLGSRAGAYYFLAFGCFFLGSSTHAARDLGWLPQNFATENGPYLGSAAEMILLSLGLASRIKRLKEKLEEQIAVSSLASQVAHDIRSPLAALDSVIKDVAQLPEQKRIIVRNAVSRIHDIANDLICKNRELAAAARRAAGERIPATASDSASRELLSSHMAPLITEKRLQYRAKIDIAIEGRFDAASYGLFADIQPTEFKRVLSNLIDNGVEALPGKGAVTVSLTRDGDQVQLKVEDNGKGIPPEVRDRLGQRGETYGKAAGSGLGLYHAKIAVEAWGGTLEISSTVGTGTAILIRLPAATPPAWFVSQLELAPGSPVIVLDDDMTVHQIWQGRFDALAAQEAGVEAIHFSRADELKLWVRSNPDKAARAIFLLDYELRGSGETGLTLAAELDLGARAILVTSRFEEKAILDECLCLNVRMIPKGLAGFVPIACPLCVRPDAVLIDDDDLVHTVWKVAATTNGKTLGAFSTPREFLAIVGRLDKSTPIYVDSKLGDGVLGEEFAKELHAQGFRNLYLATGRKRDTFPVMPWIKDVVGKKAPWS